MIFTIFTKELIDTLRDRRTIITMVVIPSLIFPLIISVSMKFSSGLTEKAMTKTVNVGVVNQDPNDAFEGELLKLPKQLGKRNFIAYKDTNEMMEQIRKDQLDFGFFVPQDYSSIADTSKVVTLKVFHNATNLGMNERAEIYISHIATHVKEKRYKQMGVNPSHLEPILVNYQNVASEKETLAQLAGGILPYLFIAFGFMGCMYPAIDLFTGEKERGTLETLLTTPVSRWQILIGKMLVVVLSGIMSATFTFLGIFLTIEVFDLIKDPKILEIIHQILTLKFVIMFYFILIPLIVFFAGVMVPIAVYAKTFKEAQSIIAPMNAIIVLPAMVGMMPGIKLDWTTACIPIINVVLTTKELIAGTLNWNYLSVSFVMMLLLATIAVIVSYKRFGKETNLVS